MDDPIRSDLFTERKRDRKDILEAIEDVNQRVMMRFRLGTLHIRSTKEFIAIMPCNQDFVLVNGIADTGHTNGHLSHSR